jgi:1-deoxy-D-xylulose-5-phosphate synthase
MILISIAQACNMDNEKLLEHIDSPEDLKKLSPEQLEIICSELREELISTISACGGHLAPNLGAVELTVALHYAFDAPKDKFVWDVGHQAYVHKLLTGRRKMFKTLRQYNGCRGFLSPEESEYDTFGGGHAGTAISAALGMATARDRQKTGENVVAILGDGSLSCGISLEGLNSISSNTHRMIIVLNDNKMSISKNVGALSNSLNRIISTRGYNRFKAGVVKIVQHLPYGSRIRRIVSRFEEAAKSMIVPGVIFEEMGIRYIGPINGHDLPELIRTFDRVKEFSVPVLVHVITEKGRGYSPAEDAPEKFHGLAAFDPDTGKSNGDRYPTTFSKTFGKTCCDLAEKHDNLAVITAAMRSGTGLLDFSKEYPNNFFDVGIAEEHAVVFGAGLATSGMKVIVALYATFMQRALDCVFHDVCLQNLPMIFCLDRAGIVEDGPTHHGIHEVAFLRNLPNISILSPGNETELTEMMQQAIDHQGPVVIRYPRGYSGVPETEDTAYPIEWGKSTTVKEGSDIAIWALGREIYTALKVAEILEEKYNISARVVNPRFIKPFDADRLINDAEKMPLVTLEDCQISAGLGGLVDEVLVNQSHKGVMHLGWGNDIVPHGNPQLIRQAAGLLPEQIAETCAEYIKNKN